MIPFFWSYVSLSLVCASAFAPVRIQAMKRDASELHLTQQPASSLYHLEKCYFDILPAELQHQIFIPLLEDGKSTVKNLITTISSERVASLAAEQTSIKRRNQVVDVRTDNEKSLRNIKQTIRYYRIVNKAFKTSIDDAFFLVFNDPALYETETIADFLSQNNVSYKQIKDDCMNLRFLLQEIEKPIDITNAFANLLKEKTLVNRNKLSITTFSTQSMPHAVRPTHIQGRLSLLDYLTARLPIDSIDKDTVQLCTQLINAGLRPGRSSFTSNISTHLNKNVRAECTSGIGHLIGTWYIAEHLPAYNDAIQDEPVPVDEFGNPVMRKISLAQIMNNRELSSEQLELFRKDNNLVYYISNGTLKMLYPKNVATYHEQTTTFTHPYKEACSLIQLLTNKNSGAQIQQIITCTAVIPGGETLPFTTIPLQNLYDKLTLPSSPERAQSTQLLLTDKS